MASARDLLLFVPKVVESLLEFVNDPYGNYLIQHLLERCGGISPDAVADEDQEDASKVFAKINWTLHSVLGGNYAWLARQKFSSNVVEKCLRTFDAKLRSEVITELTQEGTVATLLQCSFGNYVMQNVLDVADSEQAQLLIARIQPDLLLLRKNIRKKWERLLVHSHAETSALLRDANEKEAMDKRTYVLLCCSLYLLNPS
jgi:hypothetical protein